MSNRGMYKNQRCGSREWDLLVLRFFIRWLILLDWLKSETHQIWLSECQWFHFNNFHDVLMCINSYAAYFIDQSHIFRRIDIDVPFLVWFFLSFTTWFLWISLFSWILELWKISYFRSIMHGKALNYILWFASSLVRTDHPTFCKPCRLVS